MKYSEAIDIHVLLSKNKYACNETVSGEIKIKNNHNAIILIKEILVNLILKHQGRGETDSFIIDRMVVNNYHSIKPREIITLNFEFKPTYNVTYIGENMAQNIFVKTKVDIKKESEKELRNQAISKLKVGSFFRGVFKPDFFDETLVKVIRGGVNYEIKRAEGSIIPGRKQAISIMGVSFVALAILSAIVYNILDKQIEVFYVSSTLFLIILGYLYFFRIVPSSKTGKIKYNLNNIKGNFYEAVLNFEKRNRDLKEIGCQLIAIEKVTYDNGSSRSTVKKTLYKSKQHIINSFGRSIIEEIELPKESLPITIHNNDFEIIWKLIITAITEDNLKLVGTSVIDIGFEKDDTFRDYGDVDFT